MTDSPLAQQWDRIDDIFRAAIELPEEQRAALLDHACGEDAELRRCVDQLLECDRQAEADDFLGCPPDDVDRINGQSSADHAPDPLIGTQLGPYQLTEKIAEGGTGIVYRATRTEDFQQWVAIKILRWGFQDEEGRRRFWAEKQALAELAHPNIARILDADTAPDGSPYLVMELVDGGPIDVQCESQAIPLRQKLEWFYTVCRAVAYAHSKGILHRDLKPANVLITQDGRPVVTDFGLAKFLAGPHCQVASLTSTGAILGTPGYMAPEQIDGKGREVGFPTDVYGLGAILYTLLVDRPPFRDDSVASTLLRIRTDDPIGPRRLVRTIPRDLDTICLHCLKKDPGRRYPSVDALADDLQRYLGGMPISARRLGGPERLVRWISRNRVASALFAVIVTSLITVAWLLVVAEQRREYADSKRREARATVDTMFTETSKFLEEYPNTGELQRRLLSLALDAYERFSREQSDNPAIQAEAATATFRLALIEVQLGDKESFTRHGREALARFQVLVRRFPANDEFVFDLFHCHFLLTDYDEAYRIISGLCRRNPRPEYRDALAAAAAARGFQLMRDFRDRAGAQEMFLLGLDTARQLSEEFPEVTSYHRHVGTNSAMLSTLRAMEGQFSQADQLARDAMRVGQAMREAEPRNQAFSRDYCRYCLYAFDASFALGDLDSVASLLEECGEVQQQWLAMHSDSEVAWICLGEYQNRAMHFALYSDDEVLARQYSTDYLETLESTSARWPSPITLNRLARFLVYSPWEELRDPARADEIIRSLGADCHPVTAGIVHLRNGRMQEGIASLQAADPTDSWDARVYLALAYTMIGDDAAADANMPEDTDAEGMHQIERVVTRNLVLRERDRFQRDRL